MMRLVKSEIEQVISLTGEIDCLKWKKIKFSWSRSINNVDEYEAVGYFVGLTPKFLYEKLTISADFQNNVFFLKTGNGKPLTWINVFE